MNATWPVASWSSLDHGGGWKLLHYMARRFFSPVAVFAIPGKGGQIEFIGINDTREPVSVRLETGTIFGDEKSSAIEAVLQPGTPAVLQQLPAGEAVQAWTWTASNGMAGQDHFSTAPYKRLPLEAPRIVIETVEAGGALEITLTSQRPALFVSLESEQAGRFDDNCFTLLPGIAKLIRFTPAHPMAPPAGIAVRDLFTATHRG
jgi:beta-mannosidase